MARHTVKPNSEPGGQQRLRGLGDRSAKMSSGMVCVFGQALPTMSLWEAAKERCCKMTMAAPDGV